MAITHSKQEENSLTQRQDIRKMNKGNSFYDVMEPRSYKENQKYKLVAGITKAVFKEGRN